MPHIFFALPTLPPRSSYLGDVPVHTEIQDCGFSRSFLFSSCRPPPRSYPGAIRVMCPFMLRHRTAFFWRSTFFAGTFSPRPLPRWERGGAINWCSTFFVDEFSPRPPPHAGDVAGGAFPPPFSLAHSRHAPPLAEDIMAVTFRVFFLRFSAPLRIIIIVLAIRHPTMRSVSFNVDHAQAFPKKRRRIVLTTEAKGCF